MCFRETELRKDPACPLCGEDPEITELIDYERFCGVAGEDDVPGSAAGRRGSPDEEAGVAADADVVAGGTANGVPEMGVGELKRRLDAGEELAIMDVREPHEWRICNLEEHGAELIPMARVPERGYDNAVNLAGGIRAWAEEIDEEMPNY